MGKYESNIEVLFKRIKCDYHESTDVNSRILEVKKRKVGYVFLESVSSDDKISEFLVQSLSRNNKKKNIFKDVFLELENNIYNSKIKISKDYEDIFYYLSAGFTLVFVDGYTEAILIETKAKLDRGVTESSSESIIRGPKDSFTENHMTNIGLIRKRIKDPKLVFEELKLGRRTRTKTSIAYISDIVDNNKVKYLTDKLKKIDIDGVLDSGILRDYISSNNKSAFPKIISTERPDYCSNFLLEGRIVILVENSPFALVLPGILMDIFHVAEDYYQEPFNVTGTRILRFLGFLITMLTPGIYIALTTYNFEIIPNNLLISLAVQRQGVPFPTAFEVMLLLTTFEILRESDIRLPNQMGAAVSIVGALVLGEAAVSAGIVSPIVVIIVALTSVSGLLFNDIDVVNGIRFWRTVFIVASSFMGLIGTVIAGFIFIIKLSSVECLDSPYLSIFSPFNLDTQKNGIIKYPQIKMKKRPFFLKSIDDTRVGE